MKIFPHKQRNYLLNTLLKLKSDITKYNMLSSKKKNLVAILLLFPEMLELE
jgi:hypothetical protein